MRVLFIPFLLLTASGTRLKDLCGFLKKVSENLFGNKNWPNQALCYSDQTLTWRLPMSTSLIYHTQGIVGFQHERPLFSEGKAVQRISRREFRCPLCHTGSVSTYPLRERLIQGLPYGTKPTYFRVTVHRIYCPKCKQSTVEKLPFLSHSEARQTQAFERSIIELRRDMSISAISRHHDIAWSSVKEIEKRHLQCRFALKRFERSCRLRVSCRMTPTPPPSCRNGTEFYTGDRFFGRFCIPVLDF